MEYFCEPADMPTWVLSADGRSRSREEEMLRAARQIGRRVMVSRWPGGAGWDDGQRELFAPLGLWLGPVAFAIRVAHERHEQPFRGFAGGRNQSEGGGASRIRSSQRRAVRKDVR